MLLFELHSYLVILLFSSVTTSIYEFSLLFANIHTYLHEAFVVFAVLIRTSFVFYALIQYVTIYTLTHKCAAEERQRSGKKRERQKTSLHIQSTANRKKWNWLFQTMKLSLHLLLDKRNRKTCIQFQKKGTHILSGFV